MDIGLVHQDILSGAIVYIYASGLAGVLWDRVGAPATFVTGGAFALLCLVATLALRAPRQPSAA